MGGGLTLTAGPAARRGPPSTTRTLSVAESEAADNAPPAGMDGAPGLARTKEEDDESPDGGANEQP